MDNAAFISELKAENEALLSKLDAPPAGAAADAKTLAVLVKMALKNEMEAAEIAAEWVPTTPEIAAKLALAQHAGDEARHYVLIEAEARKLGIAPDPKLDGWNPLDPPSPVLTYLRTLQTTVERVAAALVAREAMGGRRNAQFLAFLEKADCPDLAALYRYIINPDEERHHRSGCEVLAQLVSTPEARQSARSACRGLLETGDRVRTAALAQTGAPVIPGC